MTSSNRLLKILTFHNHKDKLATNEEEAVEAARKIGFPVLVRPSYVLGGRAMEIVENEDDLLFLHAHSR